MNKFFLMLFIPFFTTCKILKDDIVIKQKEIDKKIVIRSASDDPNSIITIQFPSSLVLINNSLFRYDFLDIDYKYDDSLTKLGDLGIEIYQEENDTLKRIRNNTRKNINPKETKKIVYYTRHFVDSSKLTQQHFKPYLSEMLVKNKDTLHVGTVSAFKQKHKELFEKLTKNDSISVRFLDNGKLGERITVPVKW